MRRIFWQCSEKIIDEWCSIIDIYLLSIRQDFQNLRINNIIFNFVSVVSVLERLSHQCSEIFCSCYLSQKVKIQSKSLTLFDSLPVVNTRAGMSPSGLALSDKEILFESLRALHVNFIIAITATPVRRVVTRAVMTPTSTGLTPDSKLASHDSEICREAVSTLSPPSSEHTLTHRKANSEVSSCSEEQSTLRRRILPPPKHSVFSSWFL